MRAERILGLAAVLLLATGMSARGQLLVNGDFETGDLTGWTPFTTSGGTIGTPSVVSFDTTGSGASNAAQFNVGKSSSGVGGDQGGGLSQDFGFGGGTLVLSADVAANETAPDGNVAAGKFQLLLNGNVVDTYDPGGFGGSGTYRGHLGGTLTGLAPGTYTLSIQITRPFTQPFFGGLSQYVDNVSALGQPLSAVPEPSGLVLAALAGAGGLGLGLKRRAG